VAPRTSWLDRGSTNRDAVVLAVLGLVGSVLLSVLDATSVVKTLPAAVWIATAAAFAGFLAGVAVARRGRPADVERYVEHTTDAVNTLQRVASGAIPDFDAAEFVREGIFEPAHAILCQRGRGDVRFSVLQPKGQNLAMELALGHSVDSRRLFSLPVAGSFAGLTLMDGEPRVSNDTSTDERFKVHPQAKPGREYGSIVVVPIRRGDEIERVLVAVAQHPGAFADADVAYLRHLAAIAGLARVTLP
jgi:GAF domain-containing protein